MAAQPELRYAQLQATSADVRRLVSVAFAVGEPLIRALMAAGTDQTLHILRAAYLAFDQDPRNAISN